MDRATKFAEKKTIPAQKQEETLFDVSPEGELDLGTTAEKQVEKKPVAKKVEPKVATKKVEPKKTKFAVKAPPIEATKVPDSANIRAYLKMAVQAGDLKRAQAKKGAKVTYEPQTKRGIQTLSEVADMRRQAKGKFRTGEAKGATLTRKQKGEMSSLVR